MAESDPLRSSDDAAASVPEARQTPSEDGVSATVAPDDDDSVPIIDWSIGQVILDDYVVERELGAGGMGKVYLLRSRSTGQPFAVKRALLRNEDSRRNFLAELRTWIDLPEHPHLVACRFFRTVGDEVVIFAEYVEGGALETLIHERRLKSLEQILDAAIQFAWGLHAAHELGLVHQDVKPSNALVTADGLVKVADFGLARARTVAVQGADEARLRPDVTSYMGTPAYKSPEQAAGERLTLATDVWSWGLAVLEMFSGERFWTAGVAALWSLEAFLNRPADPGLPTMPIGVAEVLQKCFRLNSAKRWASLAEAAEALKNAYRQAVGKDYPRLAPAVPYGTRQAVITHNRRTTEGGHWTDPREWLIEAFKTDGRNLAQVEAFLPPRAGSRKAQAIADLAAYEEASRIFERLVAEGRKDLEPVLANLCIEKAVVHWDTDDIPGAVALYDRASVIYERLVEREGLRELAENLASTHMDKALAVSEVRDNRAAVAMYDRAIAIYERLVEEGRQVSTGNLALAYMNKANSLDELGNHGAAVAMYDRAIDIHERLVEEGQGEQEDGLAMAIINKALAVAMLGDNRAAVVLQERAVAILERLVEQNGRRELADTLAKAYLNKARTVSALGEKRAAVDVYERAVAIYERLVEQEGRRELADDLARTYMNKALAVSALGENGTAVALFDRAVAILERLVEAEGRRDLAYTLAEACGNKGLAVSAMGDNGTATVLYDRTIAILERLVEREGQSEFASDLAHALHEQGQRGQRLGRQSLRRGPARSGCRHFGAPRGGGGAA